MTNTTKNTTIVLAFAAILMAWPLAGSEAFADTIITNVGETCGFSISPAPSFGAITRGAASITEQSVVFTPTGASTGTGMISVLATDWIGDGARSTGSVVMSGIANTETVTINSVVYTAGASESTPTFTHSGSDIEDAASLARVINAGSDTANVRAYTSGTATVFLEAETRGAGGNFGVATNCGSCTANAMTGGGASPESHIQGETTKFNMVADDGTSTGVNYATKSKSMPAASITEPQEMLGNIDTTKNVNLSMEFSSAFLTAATGTITFTGTGSIGDKVTVQGIQYTGAASTSGTSWAIGASATDSANALASVIDTNPNLSATNLAGVVTITYDTLGTIGNIVEMTEDVDGGTVIAVSGAKLTGGTEYMENMPYDGPLTQTLTFSLECTGD